MSKIKTKIISLLLLIAMVLTWQPIKADAWVNQGTSSFVDMLNTTTSSPFGDQTAQPFATDGWYGPASGMIINQSVNVHLNPTISATSVWSGLTVTINSTMYVTAYYNDGSSLGYSQSFNISNYDYYNMASRVYGTIVYPFTDKIITLPQTNGSGRLYLIRVYYSGTTLKGPTRNLDGSITLYTHAYSDSYVIANNTADQQTAQGALDAANNAATYAQGAQIAAQNAQTAAQGAQSAATNASNQTWYTGTYGGAQESVAGIAGYIRNTQLPGLQTTVNNINNTLATDTTPPIIQKAAGQNGATCTTNGTFNVVVTATDNKAGQLQAQASVDGGAWTGWYNVPQNAIPVVLSTAGAHNITVNVKDAAGNVSSATMTAFRI